MPGIKTRLCTPMVLTAALALAGCAAESNFAEPASVSQGDCNLIQEDFGPTGGVAVQALPIASELEVPWGIAFLPNQDWLVTERPGRVRRFSEGALQDTPVVTIDVAETGEGGLLGIAPHPDFGSNRFFYVYYTYAANEPQRLANRVERYRLSEDGRTATADRIILDGIPASSIHDGGRLRFGPDGMLYIGTGEAGQSELAQDPDSLGGKILRLTPEGEVPSDNPRSGNPMFIMGIRNTQGFDWVDDDVMIITDHGPSGEFGRTGGDEINFARAGDNLGWPAIWRCETQAGMVTPALVWRNALPPGGAALYRGDAIPEWQGSLLLGSLGSEHLQRAVISPGDGFGIQSNEVYLRDQFGRLREVIQAPDESIYITTSNCDGRGSCPPGRDVVLRITR